MFKDSIFQLFYKVFHKQFIKSGKQWGVFCLLICFCIFSILSYKYIYGFQKAFIERLKGVYPVTFISATGKKIKPLKGFEHHQEFFHLTNQFSFQYTKESKRVTIIDVAFKSSSIDHLPKVIKVDNADNIYQVWVNRTMWDIVSQAKDFDGHGLYLISRENVPTYVNINQFDLPGYQPWVIFPEKLFKFLGQIMNITTIYPKIQMSEKKIQNIYQSHGMFAIRWNERLPFFHFVFYTLSQRIYVTVVLGFLLLLIIISLSVLQDTFDEFTKLITFSSRYGVKEQFLQLFFMVIITAYFLIIYFTTSFFVIYINLLICKAVPVIQSISMNTVSVKNLIIIVPFLWLISFVLVHKKFSEQSQSSLEL
jgi:hypothetical protein